MRVSPAEEGQGWPCARFSPIGNRCMSYDESVVTAVLTRESLCFAITTILMEGKRRGNDAACLLWIKVPTTKPQPTSSALPSPALGAGSAYQRSLSDRSAQVAPTNVLDIKTGHRVRRKWIPCHARGCGNTAFESTRKNPSTKRFSLLLDQVQ